MQLSFTLFEDFTIDLECINAVKDILTDLPNPKISNIKRRYERLRRLQFTDIDDESKNSINTYHYEHVPWELNEPMKQLPRKKIQTKIQGQR